MEDAYIIKGGKPLCGEVKLSGAKNVALKVIISALLFDQKVILKNIPRINDVFELINLIKAMGAEAEFSEENTVTVDGRLINTNKVDLLHASKIRVSFMFFSPLLAKFKNCYVPNPGGCRIGARPIDRIIEGMQSLGVSVNYDHGTGYYKAQINQAVSGSYRFPKSTHTGTELLILIGLLGKDVITLENCAFEPEVDELIRFLNESGADIKRVGAKISINPVNKLEQKKPFTIISDRNEAVTYATLALATKGEIRISSIPLLLIKNFIDKVREVGGGVDIINNDCFRFYYKGPLKATKIETAPHPGFMTDWQPNWAVLMTQAKGESVIIERVFENRFAYVDELRKLGADIEFAKPPATNPSEYFFFNFDPLKKYNQMIKIKGPKNLHGGVLNIADLRAGATLLISTLVATGESVVNGASILERGYENFVEKVSALGGEIEKH